MQPMGWQTDDCALLLLLFASRSRLGSVVYFEILWYEIVFELQNGLNGKTCHYMTLSSVVMCWNIFWRYLTRVVTIFVWVLLFVRGRELFLSRFWRAAFSFAYHV